MIAADALESKLTALYAADVDTEARNADRLRDLQRERNTLKHTEEGLRKELRATVAREATIQSELDDLRAQVLEIPALRKHFDSLTKEHAESKQRRQQIAADLRGELATSKATLTARDEALTKADKRVTALEGDLATEKRQAEEAKARHAAREAECRRLMRDLDAAATAIASTRAEISVADVKELDDHIHVAHLRALRLQRQIADRDAQSFALIELVQDLEVDRDNWREHAGSLEDELSYARLSAARDRSEAASARRAAEREASMVQQRLQEAKEESAEARRRIAIETVSATVLLAAADDRLACTREELVDVRSALSTSETEAAALTKRLAAAETSLTATTHELDNTKAELNDTREDRDDALRAKAKAEASLVEVTEARQRLTGLLTQSRAAEAALEEELASAEESLAELQGLREAYARLRTTLEPPSLRPNLAERDAATLSALNAELGGHATSQQKIHHLAKVRNELADLRRKHASSVADLAASRRDADALRVEVESYKAVGSIGPQSKLARVLRPLMADVGNRV